MASRIYNQSFQQAKTSDGLAKIVGLRPTNTGHSIVKDKKTMAIVERKARLENQKQDLIDKSSVYNCDEFPALPEFPCMSSSSSSSSIPMVAKPIASSSQSSTATSSSSVAPWDPMSKTNQNQHDVSSLSPPALSSTVSLEEALLHMPKNGIDNNNCMNVMDDLGCINLFDSIEFWDPSSILRTEEFHQDHFSQFQQRQVEIQQSYDQAQKNDDQYVAQNNNEEIQCQKHLNELGMMFYEWLKANKEHISPEDMRSIKIKEETIKCAYKHLGETQDGKKQLVKLILDWVQQCQLHKKPQRESTPQLIPSQYQAPTFHQNPNPNLSCNGFQPEMNPSLMPSPWLSQQPPSCVTSPEAIVVAPPAFPPMGEYSRGGAPLCCCGTPVCLKQNLNGQSNYQHSTEYQTPVAPQTRPPSHFATVSQCNSLPENNNNVAPIMAPPQSFVENGNQHPSYQGNCEQLAGMGSSATKEARKKRMARQKRFVTHPRHYYHRSNQNLSVNQHSSHGNGAQANLANWVHRLPKVTTHASSKVLVVSDVNLPNQPHLAQNQQQHQALPEKRLGFKGENNLKFLLQKVLKQSDVGSLGRIVLPKRDAEIHLPLLEARDGITIAMEDIGLSRVWSIRYRFWPNNKSRMYILENTADFIRENGLQAGDFIVLYSDVKSRKYLIRGVKVRP
ncbi:B3 domain-containing transcription factor ABI3-like [Diospyros lotus]|uniref:B3 domain-containing transcription factor ABI3-like n=1 Tax=Diospyros lotus TaxID=55363 RepID=UPI002251EE6D|nr:B3 domain-containing transcription factor ABI3-like [Diospyros lotus]